MRYHDYARNKGAATPTGPGVLDQSVSIAHGPSGSWLSAYMDVCLWNSASSRTRRCRTRWHGLFKARVPIDRFGVLNLHRTSHTPALFFRTVPPHNLSPLSGKKNMPAPALLNTNSTRASQCKKPITVESITKHHTKTGAIHYHLIFSNKKEHLVRQLPFPPPL